MRPLSILALWALAVVSDAVVCHGADLVVRWTRQLGSPISTSAARLPSGEILVGTQGTPNPDSNALPNQGGFLRALRADGADAWRVSMFGGLSATPHVAPDGTVYAASMGSWGTGGRMYRIRDGTVEWSRAHEGQTFVPGALGHGDRVYVLHAMGGVRAWRTNGTVAWERSYVGTVSWVSEAAVMADGTLLVGLGRGVGQLVALSSEGEELWSADAHGIVGPPQIAPDGTIYVGGGAHDASNAAEVPPPVGQGSQGLRAYNPDGSFRWSLATPGRLVSAPVIGSSGTVFGVDDLGTVIAVDRLGRRVWSQSVGSAVVASPALASDGTLYLATVDGRLVGLTSAGEPAGEVTLGGELRTSPLILPDGLVVVAGMEGTVHGVEGTSGPAEGPAFALRDTRRSGRDDTSAPTVIPAGLRWESAEDGVGVRLRWDDLGPEFAYDVRRDGPGDESSGGPRMARYLREPTWWDRTAPSGRTLSYSVRARNAGGVGPWSAALDVVRPVAGFGEVAWFHEDPQARGAVALGPNGAVHVLIGDGVLRRLDGEGRLRWSFTNAVLRFHETPVVLSSGVVAVGGSEPFLAGGPMHLLSPEGSEVALIPNLSSGRLPAVDEGDALVYPTWDQGLTRRLPDGTIAWTVESSSGWSTPSLWADGTIYQPGSRLLDVSGRPVWTVFTDGSAVHGALGREGTAYLGGGTGETAGLIAVGSDGARRWSVPLTGGLGGPPIVLTDDSIVAGSPGGEVVRVNPDGSVRWRYQAGAGLPASGAAAADGTVWIGTEDGRLLGLSAEGALRSSLKLGARIESPPAIGEDGRVYVAVDGAGVYAIQGSEGPGTAPWPMFRGTASRTGRGLARSVAPAAPVGLTASEEPERGTVTLSWQPVPYAESYEVLRGPGPNMSDMAEIRSDLSGATSFADRTAAPDVVWHYRVRARNRLGAGEPSAAASGRQTFRRWWWTVPAGLWGTPAVASDGSLRVAVGRVPVPESGLVALEADGRVRWRVEGMIPTSGPVIGSDDVAYVAINARELAAIGATGEVLWRKVVAPGGSQSIALDGELAITGDGLVLVPIETGPLLALDAGGNEVWRTTGVQCFRGTAPVIADDGAIAVSAAFGGTPVLERTGVRRFSIALPPQSRPVITPAGEWLGYGDSRLVRVSRTGMTNLSLRLIPASPGPASILVEPDGGILLTVERRGTTAYRPDGSVRWTGTNGQWTASLAAAALLADGTVVSIEGDQMVARDRADGGILWRCGVGPADFSFTTPGPRRTPVVTPEGLVLVVGRTNLVAFGPVANAPGGGWPLDRFDVRRTANLSGPAPAPEALRSITASSGTWVEQVRLTWATNADLAVVEVWGGSSPNREEARLLGTTALGQFRFAHSGAAAGVTQTYWLRATNRAGVSAWSEPVTGQATPGVFQRAALRATTNLLAAALGRDGRIHAVEDTVAEGRLWTWSEDGAPAWSAALASRPTTGPVVAPDGTVRVIEQTHVVTVDPLGTIRSRVPLGNETVGDPATAPDGTFYFLDNGNLRAVGLDGVLRWETPIEVPIPGVPCIVDAEGNIVFPGQGRLERFLPSGTASTPWLAGENPPLGRLVLTPEGDAIYPGSQRTLVRLSTAGIEVYSVGSGDGTGWGEPVLGPALAFGSSSRDGVVAVAADGTEQWRYPARRPGLVALADGGLIVAHTNRVVSLGPEGRERWQFEAAAGNVTPPFLLDDGRLVFTAGPEVVVLQTGLQPASGRWAMFRGDPQRSGRMPASAAARITGLQDVGAEWQLRFRASPGTRWTVEASVDLQAWQATEGGPVLAADGETTVTVSPVQGAARFLRLRQLEDPAAP